MLGRAENLVNTDVFVRLHVFSFLLIFVVLGSVLRPHFGHFWGSWETNLLIFRVLEIGSNFIDLHGLTRDTPQAEGIGSDGA